MKNLKLGNLLIIVLLGLIVIFFSTGVIDIEKLSNKDLKQELKQVKSELKEHDSSYAIYAQKMRDELEIEKELNKKLSDSLNKMHISYMNDSYLKEHYDTTHTYWYINYTHTEWKKNDKGETERTNYYSNHVIKFKGRFCNEALEWFIDEVGESYFKRKLLNKKLKKVW